MHLKKSMSFHFILKKAAIKRGKLRIQVSAHLDQRDRLNERSNWPHFRMNFFFKRVWQVTVGCQPITTDHLQLLTPTHKVWLNDTVGPGNLIYVLLTNRRLWSK